MTALISTPQTQRLTTLAKKIGLAGIVRFGRKHYWFQNAVNGWDLGKTVAGAEARLREIVTEMADERPPTQFMTGG